MKLLLAWCIFVTIVGIVVGPKLGRDLARHWPIALAAAVVILGFVALMTIGFLVHAIALRGARAIPSAIIASLALSAMIVLMWTVKTAVYAGLEALGVPSEPRFFASMAIAVAVVVLPAKLWLAHYVTE